MLIASPGPVVALVIAEARRGRLGWTILGGVLSAQVLMVTALVMIAMAVDIQPGVLDWGQVAGGGYLCWLGVDALRTSPDVEAPRGGQPAVRQFWKAFAVGLSNPKDILFFLAFLPAFIRIGEAFLPQAVALLLIWISIDLTILLGYGLLSRRLAGQATLNCWLRHLPGYVLLGFGGLSLLAGLNRLVGA